MPSKSYILFHTDSCHLCELAEQLIETSGVLYIKTDICDDEKLVEQYGIRIPVLKQVNSQSELNWPFNENVLNKFLGA
ncbi:MAG: glutaredoxin family protein [Shewanella sp.]